MQAGAALVAAANEAVRARHAGALEQACTAIKNLAFRDGAFEAALVAVALARVGGSLAARA